MIARMPQRLSLALAAVGALLLLWPVPADATRFELIAQSGSQTLADLDRRLADPAQRPWLERRPLCGVPLLAPITYMDDGCLRHGCAGPNGRSMSLAALPLLAAAALRRPRTAGARPERTPPHTS